MVVQRHYNRKIGRFVPFLAKTAIGASIESCNTIQPVAQAAVASVVAVVRAAEA